MNRIGMIFIHSTKDSLKLDLGIQRAREKDNAENIIIIVFAYLAML